MTRLPIIPTVLVVAAAAVMVALGIWQLGRADEKAALIERYSRAGQLTAPVPFPRNQREIADRLYRYSQFRCSEVVSQTTKAAQNRSGRSGIGLVAVCGDGDSQTDVVLGWRQEPKLVEFEGGVIEGWLSPLGEGVQLVADPAVAGLEPVRRPDPANLPNNHLAYAGQWFFFALTALVIYFLALSRRRRERSPAPK